METNIDTFLSFDWIAAHPPQETWTNEEIRFDSPKCIKECTKYKTGEYLLTWDESVATDPDALVIG